MPLSATDPQPEALHWTALIRSRGARAVLLVELIVVIAVAYGLWTLRHQTLDAELRVAASLSAAMAEQAEGTLDVANAVLHATQAELTEGLLVPEAETANAWLAARLAALPQFTRLAIFDAQGVQLASSDDKPAEAANAGKALVDAVRQAPPTSLVIGSPRPAGPEGKASIGLSMGWRGPAGELQGVIVLTAPAELLDGGFVRIAPTADANLAIYRRDGSMVSDGPADDEDRLLPAATVKALWADAAQERPRLVGLPDGRSRLVAAHALQRFPLIVVVTRELDAVMTDWSDQAWLVGSFAASALILTLVLTLRNMREQILRRASELALAAEQERAVRAFDAAQEGHWEWRPGAHEGYLSPRMRVLMGLPRQAAPTGAVSGFGPLGHGAVHPEDLAPLREAFLAHSEGRTPVFDATFRVRHEDGQWHHIRARGHAWHDAAGRTLLYSGTGTDVSAEVQADQKQRQLEEQLQRARKLESLGTLAGGVAHDFNNILAAIVGYGELARQVAAAGSAQARQLDQVLRAAERGRALVERILSFSRSSAGKRTRFLLQPVVEEVLQLLAGSLPPQVRVQQALQAPTAVIAGDTTMVFEATMNLCTNAVQAMKEGGVLDVELQTVDLTEAQVLFERNLAPGRYLRLSVVDDGPGIAPEVMARLFEPFFTTKGPHQGTGLGLAVVHGVMVDLGGAIDVRNVPGRGACFALYFPCLALPPDADVAILAAAPPGQGQAVMVVDDEPALVELAEELLAVMGYEPVGFTSSEKALDAFKADPDRFDLVLTDEVMPQMTGTALATALHALRPRLPIVMASGYGGPQLEDRAATAGVTVLVRKPLQQAELARALARALGAR